MKETHEMTRLFKERHVRECLYLIDLEEPLSIAEISKALNIKSRTLKSDLKELVPFLASNGLTLVSKRGKGIYVVAKDKQTKQDIKKKLESTLSEVSPDRETRCKEMLLDCLLQNKIPTLEDWCFTFMVSRPTVLKDLRIVKDWLKDKGLNLVGKPGSGYVLEGKEKEFCIRDALSSLLADELHSDSHAEEGIWQNDNKKNLLKDVDLEGVEKFIENIEKTMQTTITDSDYELLRLRTAISIKRIKEENIVEMDQETFEEIAQSPTYNIIAGQCGFLENYYDIVLPPEEIAYLTLLFLTAKPQNPAQTKPGQKSEQYFELAKTVAQISQDVLGIPLAYDTELIDMLAAHLETTISRIKYGFDIENPLAAEVKDEYPLYFSVAKVIATLLTNKLGIRIMEDEVAYIAMYIATAAEKAKTKNAQKKRVAVFCPLGIGMSNFIYWKLANELPEVEVVQVGSYKELSSGKLEPDINLIVSTIPLPNTCVPSVVVSHLLNTEEIKKIKEKLNLMDASLHSLLHLFDERLILLNVETKDRTEALSLLASRMVQYDYTKPQFVDAIIKREEMFPTAINAPIPFALPHVEYDYTIKEGFGLAFLSSPVLFKEMGNPDHEMPIKIILMPALLSDGKLGKILSQLLELMKDTKFIRKLLAAKSASEIRNLLIKELSQL